MKQVNVHEAKSQLSALIAAAQAGEEVIIARANKPVAKLIALRTRPTRQIGEAKGLLEIKDDFDELPEDFIDSFE